MGGVHFLVRIWGTVLGWNQDPSKKLYFGLVCGTQRGPMPPANRIPKQQTHTPTHTHTRRRAGYRKVAVSYKQGCSLASCPKEKDAPWLLEEHPKFLNDKSANGLGKFTANLRQAESWPFCRMLGKDTIARLGIQTCSLRFQTKRAFSYGIRGAFVTASLLQFTCGNCWSLKCQTRDSRKVERSASASLSSCH